MADRPYLRQGFLVSYVGLPEEGLLRGDRGTLVSFANEEAAHIHWKTGARLGQIDLMDLHDIDNASPLYAVHSINDDLDDSLDMATVLADDQDFDHEMVFEAPIESVLGESTTILEALLEPQMAEYVQEAVRNMMAHIEQDHAGAVRQMQATDPFAYEQVVRSLLVKALLEEESYGE